MSEYAGIGCDPLENGWEPGNDIKAHRARIKELNVEIVRLREALEKVISACDAGRLVSRGAGGMTIEAQIRNSVYNGVPAWSIEEARAILSTLPELDAEMGEG